MSDFLRHYFGLGLFEGELILGPDEPRRIPVGAILQVVLIYLGVFLGVIAEYILEAIRAAGAGPIQVGLAGFYKGWLVATLLFPLVWPKVFGLSDTDSGASPLSENAFAGRTLRFFVAFQNGFFWQAVLM